MTACAPNVTPEAWRNTPRNGFWSREEIVKPLLERNPLDGKTRAEVLRVLGEPDISDKIVAEEKRHESRNDTYQLSFLNTTSLEIEYDENDNVVRSTFGPGCLANYFPGPEARSDGSMPTSKSVPESSFGNSGETSKSLPANPTHQTNYALRKDIPVQLLNLEEKELEKLWGEPDLSDEDNVPTFPTPLRMSYYSWRVTPDGRIYNLAETDGAYNVAPAHRRILSLRKISLSPDCPVRRRAYPNNQN
jgi:hypothetical protein